MAISSDSPPSDTIVVGGSYDEESPDESMAEDDSFDAYGEDDVSGQEQTNEVDHGNDAYARTFDSPAQDAAQVQPAQEIQPSQEIQPDQEVQQAQMVQPEREAQQAAHEVQQDVSQAHESMNSSTASDAMPAQSTVAPASPPSSSSSSEAATPDPESMAVDVPQVEEQPSFVETGPVPAIPAASPSPDAEPAAKMTLPTRTSDDESPSDTAAAGNDAAPNSPSDAVANAIDLQKLVDDITAKADADAAASAREDIAKATSSARDENVAAASNVHPSLPPAPVGASPMSLPPKPTLHHGASPAQAHSEYFQPSAMPSVKTASMPMGASAPSHLSSGGMPVYPTLGAPGTVSDGRQRLPPPPSFGTLQTPERYPAAQGPTSSGAYPSQGPQSHSVDQAYEAFLQDERRYMHEAKWERFPDGSRIFIGNLSQERVSKRDVFNLFQVHGRLAQISLKSAYGFVQYHTVTDAQSAMEHLQGYEVRGRAIHLEYSRTQKKEKGDRSPDRNKNRGGNRGGGGGGGGNVDRYNGRDHGREQVREQGRSRDHGRRSRDDYRPGSGSGRNKSPRGDRDFRDEPYGVGRGHFDSGSRQRDRSRSPNRYSDPYRSRRSPTPPYARSREEAAVVELPRRYGSDIPDVQLLVGQELHRDFIHWVQNAFRERSLKTDVMTLDPRRISTDSVIQRQVLEGVHAVSDLDLQAQATGKIRIQVFDRSGGASNVKFNVYEGLDPPMAADVVLRTRGSANPAPVYPSAGSYGQPQPSYPPAQPMPQGYGHQQPAPVALPPQQAQALAANLDLSNIDNTTLQKLLASLAGGQANATAPVAAPIAPPAAYQQQPTAAPVDINALLGNLRSATNGSNGSPTAPSFGGAHYAPASANGYAPTSAPPAAAGSGVPDVQAIMAQLANYRK